VGQLKKGGIIVAPVGGKMAQNLVKGIKTEKGLEQSLTCGVRFVRLVGEYGFDH
jgi:protein-L-isoaspartate(D-aspartate) O-methyltransferase